MATGLAIGGLALQGIGSQQSAAQQKQAGETGAAIGEFNAQVAEQNAKIAKANAVAEEIKIRQGAKRLKGKQTAAYAASGVDVGEGSPLIALADTAREAELQALDVRTKGEIQATGFEQEAVGQRFTGGQLQQGGIAASQATILSGAGRTLASGYKLKQQGAF